MRDVILLGSGRSGTSMVAGSLARAGWFPGSRPYPARVSNPKGFFESPDVNGINEALLAAVLPPRPRLGAWQRWLAAMPEGVEPALDGDLRRRAERLVERRPFCFKDPRFCWTLPAWGSLVDDALKLVVFRDPAITAKSIVKECRAAEYLADVEMDLPRALDLWTSMYRRVLEMSQSGGDWLFLHYEQFLDGSCVDKLEAALGAPIDREFADAQLWRTHCDESISAEAAEVYRELCKRADAAPQRIPTELPPSTATSDSPEGLEVSVIVLPTGTAVNADTVASLERQVAARENYEVIVAEGDDAASRNRAIAAARGRWTLFLSTDVYADPQLVAEHMKAHRTLGDRKVSVRGPSVPETAKLANPVVRHRVARGDLFCTGMEDRVGDWTHFRADNISVPTEALRGVGGFDEGLQDLAAVDACLGLALEEVGYLVAFHGAARVEWRGDIDLDQHCDERLSLARNAWKLIARHPLALQHPMLHFAARLDADALETYVDDRLPMIAEWQRTAEAVADIDLFGIERGTDDALPRELMDRMDTALRELGAVALHRELAEGLRTADVSCFAELALPWHLDTAARTRYLAWPRYDSAIDLDMLMADWADALAGNEDACLCLRCDPAGDVPLEQAQRAVEEAYERHQREAPLLNVLFVAEDMGPGAWARLGQAIAGVLELPSGSESDRAERLTELGVPRLREPAELPRCGSPSARDVETTSEART